MPRFTGQSIDVEDLLIWAFRDELVERTDSPHPDATTIYWAVMALPTTHIGIVIRFARMGMRPQWRAGRDRVVSLAAVRKSRILYTEWVRSMVVLQRALDGALSRCRVSGPSLEEAPWRCQRARA